MQQLAEWHAGLVGQAEQVGDDQGGERADVLRDEVDFRVIDHFGDTLTNIARASAIACSTSPCAEAIPRR